MSKSLEFAMIEALYGPYLSPEAHQSRRRALADALKLYSDEADPTTPVAQASYWKGAYDRMAIRNQELSAAIESHQTKEKAGA